MIISRTWAMSNSRTFQIKPIYQILDKYVKSGMVVVDPFANGSRYGTITNDMNPDFDTDYNLDAIDFLKLMGDNIADVILYDPPYSLRQVSECYKGVGKSVTMETTQSSFRANHLDEIARILKDDGLCICFGWNSNGVGITRGFKMIEILMVAHGGSKNDTIVTVERKVSNNVQLSILL